MYVGREPNTLIDRCVFSGPALSPRHKWLMNELLQKQLPLGSTRFSALRSFGEIYVDKTAMIGHLASNRGKLFLTRPRRFGKSLLVSAFDSLFRNGVNDFKGLALEKCWSDKTYPVARMDFSLIRTFTDAEDFERKLGSLIVRTFKPLGFAYGGKDCGSVMEQLSDWLALQPDFSLVVLIDAYDGPLTAALGKTGLFDQVRAAVGEFFSVLSANEGALRFWFVTGTTKYRQTGIYTELAGLTDISSDPACSTILGFTEADIRTYFSGHIKYAAEVLGTGEADVVAQILKQYGGYAFDASAQQRVCSPWSVLNFLADPRQGFSRYWFESISAAAFLKDRLKGSELGHPVSFDKTHHVTLSSLNAAGLADEAELTALLWQEGYFTLKEVRSDESAMIGYPNAEIRVAMAQFYARLLLNGKPLP